MRVLCISTGNENDISFCPFLIKEGEEYEVIDEEIDDEGLWYELSIQPGDVYRSEYFAPLSNIDEMQLVTAREEVYG